jgi:hypothetical protein
LVSCAAQSFAEDAGLRVSSTATVRLREVATAKDHMIAAIGNGPVDAIFKVRGGEGRGEGMGDEGVAL